MTFHARSLVLVAAAAAAVSVAACSSSSEPEAASSPSIVFEGLFRAEGAGAGLAIEEIEFHSNAYRLRAASCVETSCEEVGRFTADRAAKRLDLVPEKGAPHSLAFDVLETRAKSTKSGGTGTAKQGLTTKSLVEEEPTQLTDDSSQLLDESNVALVSRFQLGGQSYKSDDKPRVVPATRRMCVDKKWTEVLCYQAQSYVYQVPGRDNDAAGKSEMDRIAPYALDKCEARYGGGNCYTSGGSRGGNGVVWNNVTSMACPSADKLPKDPYYRDPC